MKTKDIEKEIETQIQKDLDAGKFGMICSNEDTFKRYVFPIIRQALQEQKKEMKANLRKRVYAYDEREDSGCIDWKDVLEVLEEH